jgi:malonyl-CoA/methylmalonyl-CoA synthetase
MSNLYASIQASLAARPDATVLDAGEQSWSAQALDRWVGRYASALADLGLQPGDRIAVQIEKSAANIALYLAALRLGAVYVPLNTALRTV